MTTDELIQELINAHALRYGTGRTVDSLYTVVLARLRELRQALREVAAARAADDRDGLAVPRRLAEAIDRARGLIQ